MPPDPLHHPIAALTNHPILSPEAEATLIAAMLAGVRAQQAICRASSVDKRAMLEQIEQGEAARTLLVRHNLRLVVSIARRYLRGAGEHLTLEDLVSFGSIGLLQGLDRFDPRKAGKLSTYVTWWIRQAIGRGIAEESRVMALRADAKRHRPPRPYPRAPQPAAARSRSPGPAARA